ncbi:hypothetical protein [Streptomyces griseoviridis]|uniref:Uncharacterized protein n=1 Tax=Streptomyces griseoviridis TaxID=45398 RepID=A0ABT9LIR8_STRGD|nr:hypothetical protein [Streptomyces griseoviridis]MDP9682386.1 hypothetical protein [Streptomyces griseoviridis]GGS81833.1 hypothetical protein GCM10010240_14000 [Streptomyces griseoviridis]
MADEEVTRKEIAQEIGRAMIEQAKNLANYGDSKVAAAGLKDLAEALAWLNHPNQPH